MDKKHLEYKILEITENKITAYKPSERGFVMISEDQATDMNEHPCEKGHFYVLDKKNPTNKGAKQRLKSDITKPKVKDEDKIQLPNTNEAVIHEVSESDVDKDESLEVGEEIHKEEVVSIKEKPVDKEEVKSKTISQMNIGELQVYATTEGLIVDFGLTKKKLADAIRKAKAKK